MRNKITQNRYKISEGNNQLVLILNSEILLPEDAPVRVTSAQLEELDYRKLYEAYSSKGRKSVTDPRVLFKVMAYGYQCPEQSENHSSPLKCNRKLYSKAKGLLQNLRFATVPLINMRNMRKVIKNVSKNKKVKIIFDLL